MKSRVVFDCMIYLQAAANNLGPAAACIERVDDSELELCISEEVLEEVKDVLNRPNIQKKFRTLTPERVQVFLKGLERIATVITDIDRAFELTRDPKDSKYLNLAIAAGAKLVVSRDNDLLDLMTGTDDDALRLRTNYPDLRILDPVAFLKLLAPSGKPTD